MEEARQDIIQIFAGSGETCLAFLGVLFGSARLELLEVGEGAFIDDDLSDKLE